MADNAMTSIDVIIAGRTFPLKVHEKDVSTIKRIVEEVNSKVSKFQMTYSAKDKLDCLSMALLTYAVDLHKERSSGDSDQVASKINELDKVLDSLLS